MNITDLQRSKLIWEQVEHDEGSGSTGGSDWQLHAAS